jgi:hypothetical protein
LELQETLNALLNKCRWLLLGLVAAGILTGLLAPFCVSVSSETVIPLFEEPEIIVAIRAGESVETVRTILDRNPGMLDCESVAGWSPLVIASGDRRYEIMKLLLDRGARIDTQMRAMPDGETVLHIAVGINDCEMFCLLMQYGPSLHMEDRKGRSVAELIVEFRRMSVEEFRESCGCP